MSGVNELQISNFSFSQTHYSCLLFVFDCFAISFSVSNASLRKGPIVLPSIPISAYALMGWTHGNSSVHSCHTFPHDWPHWRRNLEKLGSKRKGVRKLQLVALLSASLNSLHFLPYHYCNCLCAVLICNMKHGINRIQQYTVLYSLSININLDLSISISDI